MNQLRIHGGPDALGAAKHDFSTNSNACGPCPEVMDVVRQADASRYPDATYGQLRATLAKFHGVAPERVLLAGSASEFIYRVTAWVARSRGTRVWLPAHHYGDYAAAAQAWGMQRQELPADAHLRWACDPSSPLGQAQSGLDVWCQDGAVCVIDRAYEPLRLEGSLALSEMQLQQVWQLFTPNKALGLTGIRAAYVIAPVGASSATEELESLCSSWPVGVHGEAMLMAWSRSTVQAWVADSRSTLSSWKQRQAGLCRSLGWEIEHSQANYFCARPDLQGESLAQALTSLRSQGIKLRDATSFGLPGRVRLGVLVPEAQDALHAAWSSLSWRLRT